MNLEKPVDFPWKSALNAPFRFGLALALTGFGSFAAEIDEESALKGEARSPEPIVAEASDEGQLAIQRFEIQEGFTVELVASEPQLANPVAFAIDHKGRFYTSETYRYRTSVLDIRNYTEWLEEDMALRNVEEREALLIDQFGETGAEQLAIETEMVRRLVDTDGDGVVDVSTVFADGFNTVLDGIASGVLPRRDGKVYFTNIPNVWLLDDSDQDGIAESRESLSRGYGVRFSLTGHDLHGLIMGPDGRLYFSCGDRGSHVVTREGNVIDIPDEGGVFRCEPDGSHLELFAKGLRNPQELAFDRHGNLFTGDNDSDQGDRERLVYVMEGSDSGWRVGYQWHFDRKAGPWNKERLWWPEFPGQAAYLLPPIENIDNGPSGIVFNYGVGLPEAYDGDILMCHFNGTPVSSGITAYDYASKGAGFELVGSEEIFWNCLPTDVDFGPDANLYFTDWHEGWPKSSKGRIYRGTFDGADTALKEQTREILGSDFADFDDQTLSDLLGHQDMRVRQEAQFELVRRGPTKTDVLVDAATLSQSRLKRLHGIWGVTQLARAHGANLMRQLLRLTDDADAEVRAQVVKAFGEAGYKPAMRRVLKATEDLDARVRGFAAMTLGKFGDASAMDALVAMIRRETELDPYLRHAYVMGLTWLGAEEAVATLSEDESSHVRMVSLLAQRQWKSPTVTAYLDDADALIQAEAARAINDAQIDDATDALAALLGEAAKTISGLAPRAEGSEESDTYRNVTRPILWRAINANFRLGSNANAQRIADFAADSVHETELRLDALDALERWGTPPARDLVVGVYRPILASVGDAESTVVTERDDSAAQQAVLEIAQALLSDSSEAIRLATLETIESMNLVAAGKYLTPMMSNRDLDPATRVAAFRTLAALGGDAFSQAIPVAASSDLENLRSLSLEYALGGDGDAAMAMFEDAFANGSVSFQRSAIRGLANRGDETAANMLASLVGQMADGGVERANHVELLEAAEAINQPATQEALQAYNAAMAAKPKLEQFEAALEGGDAASGETIFKERLDVACLRCHMVGGTGGEVGPVLDGIGSRKDRAYLLESIIDPAAKIADGYQMVLLSLQDGMFHAGTVVEETEDRLRINSPAEGVINIDKSVIATRQEGPSGMPPGMEYILSKSELRDLVEYLTSLK